MLRGNKALACVCCEKRLFVPNDRSNYSRYRCPRCDTDNERWFSINSPSNQTLTLWFAKRFYLARIVVANGIGLGFFGCLVVIILSDIVLFGIGVLIFSVLITTLPPIILRSQWRQLRKEKAFSKVGGIKGQPFFQYVIILAGLFLIINLSLPVIFYLIYQMVKEFPALAEQISVQAPTIFTSTNLNIELGFWFFLILILTSASFWATYHDVENYVKNINSELPSLLIADRDKWVCVAKKDIKRMLNFSDEAFRKLEWHNIKIIDEENLSITTVLHKTGMFSTSTLRFNEPSIEAFSIFYAFTVNRQGQIIESKTRTIKQSA